MTQFITCTKCEERKLFTQFYGSSGKDNGRMSWCRQCTNAYNSKKTREKRQLKRVWGIVARHEGKPYTAVFVDPYGFTPEATRQGVERANQD